MSFDNKIGEGKYVISVDNQGAITQLQQFDNKVQDSGRKAQTSFRQAAASAVSLASGIGSLYFQYDNLEKVQLRIRRSALEVSRAQEEVNKIAKEGRTGTLDYQQALERLEIAQERNKILTNDLTQSQMALGFSFAQTALSIPAAINGIKGLTSASSILSAVTSKWTLIALAAIAAYEGIAQAIKITTGHDYTLTTAVGNLTTKITGGNQALIEGTANYKAYGESISDVTTSSDDLDKSLTRTKRTIKETNDLVAMWSKINSDALKKNDEILNANQKQIDIFAQLFDRQRLVASGQDELSKRTLALALQHGYMQFNLERTIAVSGVDGSPELKAKMMGFSRIISDVFRRAAAGGGIYSNLHGSGILSQFGGITQSEAVSAINGGRTGSTRSVSGSSKARRGAGGGRNSNEKFYNNFISAFAPTGVTNRDDKIRIGEQRYASLIEELQSFGLDMPSQFGTMYAGKGNRLLRLSPEDYGQKVNSVMDELKRRKQAKVDAENARIANLVNLSGLSRSEVIAYESTSSGIDDLNGIIDFRKRVSLASSGT